LRKTNSIVRSALLCLVLLDGACASVGVAQIPTPPATAGPDPAEVRAELGVLAADSLQGRMTGTPGAERAARYIAAQLASFGVAPGYPAASGRDSAYFQGVPLRRAAGRRGEPGLTVLPEWSAFDGLVASERVASQNVVGVIPGSDLDLARETVVIAAHYDHLGVGAPVLGDSIYNGADDDASGVVAVLEIARAFAAAPPRRTVVIMLTTGEEEGTLGTLWYLGHPRVALSSTVAELEVEMIGRPDERSGGAGRAWLTGYERSNMGERLAAAGIPIVADPHPEQQFFQRSDNIVFACDGIPAHTLSSFGLHADYHQPSDDVEKVDFAHFTTVVRSAIGAARILADGPAPAWKPGGNPAADRAICTGR
jgi:hypothetical protein